MWSSRPRARRTTFDNGFSDLARPSDKVFDALVGVLDETKQGFKRLEDDPKTSRKESNGPGNKPEKDQPEEGEARISGHDESVVKVG